MISLVLSMIRARRAQAVTVWLLSAVAIAAAVAGPIALRDVDRAIVRYEVGAATNAERSLSVTAFINPSDRDARSQLDTVANLLNRPGFDQIRAGEIQAFGPVSSATRPLGASTSRVVFRDRVCEHVVMVSGRCLSGPLEVIIGENTANRLGLRPGDTTNVQAAGYDGTGSVFGDGVSGAASLISKRPRSEPPVEGRGLVSDGAEATLSVAGIYRPRDAEEVYWAGQSYFPLTADGTRGEVVFLSVLTFDLIEHSLGRASVDSLALPQTLTLDRLAGLPAEMQQITGPIEAGQPLSLNTGLPNLAARVQRSRELAHELVPIAFVPLVALCFFVIYLAARYGVFGRRQELGMVTLRGVTKRRRWWLATGETVLAVIAGAPVGYLLGHLTVGLVSWLRLGGATTFSVAGLQDLFDLDPAALRYAGVALAGALLVALLGLRRTMAEPVVQLLRGVKRGSAVWRSLTIVEVLVLALAVVATVQLRRSGQELRGVVLLVPGLVVVSVALMAARGFVPLTGVVARRALRRGRLATGLAAVQLARRPGSQQLFVLLAVASAMLTFVASGIDVAAQARENRALIATGAATVLTVDQGDARRMLDATRGVDPAGAWAMAVMSIDQKFPKAPPLLAVDSSRLAAVATWPPEFGVGAAEVAAALRPPAAQPLIFKGSQLSVDVETAQDPDKAPIDLTLNFVPLTGGDVIATTVSQLVSGRTVRTVGVTGCDVGCRLTSLSARPPRGDGLRLTLHRIGQLDPPREVIPAADLINPGRWRATGDVRLAPLQDALQIVASGSPFGSGEITVATVDAAVPIPVAAAGDLADNGGISSVDGELIDAKVAASPLMLPRLGVSGVLADLEYLERTALLAPRRAEAQVWLGPNAPADAADRLRRAGLAVSHVTGVDQSREVLARQGPALAIQFHLAAAVFGIVLALCGLGLVATVDRRRRADDLRALRQQGLSQRTVRRAALWSYLSTVVAAMLAGLVAGGAAWLAAGDRLPIFNDAVEVLRPPRWPEFGAVLVPWALATAVMVIGSVVVAWGLRRAVVRNGMG